MNLRILLLALGLLCTCAGCKKAPPVPETAVASDGGAAIEPVVRFRASSASSACTFAQGGPFLDFGEGAERWRVRDAAGVDDEEREGASWWAIDSRTLRVAFALDGADAPLEEGWAIDLRVLATESRTMSVLVNDRVVGAVHVDGGPPRIETVRLEKGTLVAGENVIALAARRPNGVRAGTGRTLVDWVHVRREGPAIDKLARPSRRAVSRVTARGGESYKAFSLPDGASVVCAMPIPRNAATTAALAVEGGGEVEAELRWHVPGRELPPVARVVVKGAEKNWLRLDGGAPTVTETTMAAVEVRVVRATQASRLLVADFGWSTPSELAAEAGPPTEGVVVVVLSHVGASDLPALRAALPGGDGLLVTERYRSGALSGNAAIAALLSGQRPELGAVLDPDSRVSPAFLTLPRALKSAGVKTFFSSGHPLSGASHGFVIPDWDRVTTHPPLAPSTAPLQDFAEWYDQVRPPRFFALVHLRGGHAPFDLRPAEAQALAPKGYTGTVDPEQVASWWSRHPRGPLRLSEADRTRLDALHDASLAKQLTLLAKVVADVRRAQPKTVVIVTTDVGFRPHDALAYDEGVLLAHDTLVAPLVSIGLPRLTNETVALRDVHATVAELLGRGRIARSNGRPLWRDGREDLTSVSSGRARAFWIGSLAFESPDGVDARLCSWATDPECRSNETQIHAALRDGFRRIERELAQAPQGVKREPVVVDGALEKALRAWGL